MAALASVPNLDASGGQHLGRRRDRLGPSPSEGKPLLAPPLGCVWETTWTSEDPRYGGGGTPAIDSDDNWNLPAEFAALLTPISAP